MSPGDSMSGDVIDRLMKSMSLTEKVGQLNQRLFGWKCLTRRHGHLETTDYLKREIDRWGGLGLLYGLFRADPWSGRDWDTGILPEERAEAAWLVQEEVSSRGAHGLGALLCEEAPHGHQALGGSVLPINLALGATFDPDLVGRAQAAVARELAQSGVHVALVSGLDLAVDPRWGRCEECFGEDPELASRMCAATVRGMQGDNRSAIGHGGLAVVMKHMAAQGASVGGRNGQSVPIGMHDLRQIHLAPVRASVQAGALGLMAAYNDIDGVPCCANPWLLDTYLRQELGFDGIVMADGLAVDRLEEMTGSISGAGRTALVSGIDVSLWDRGFTTLVETAQADPLVERAVDRSLRRVLELKHRFFLLPDDTGEASCDHGGPSSRQTIRAGREGLESSMEVTRRLSEDCSRSCLVELSGDPALTLDSCGPGPLVVTGPLAQDDACFLGDYTAPQRGGEIGGVWKALTSVLAGRRQVLLEPDPFRKGSVTQLGRAALVVQVVGGTSRRDYNDEFADNGAVGRTGGTSATGGEGVDRANLALPWNQDAVIRQVRAVTDAPIISLVVAGRAHALGDLIDSSDRVIWAGYAGPSGPEALADCILGRASCQGRMPFSLPTCSGVLPVHYNDRQSATDVYRDSPRDLLVSFGYCNRPAGRLPDRLVLDLPGRVRLIQTDDGLPAGAVAIFRSVGGARIKASYRPADSGVDGSVNLYMHRLRGRVLPRRRELLSTTRVHAEPGDSWQAEWSCPGQAFMPGEEGTVVELFDDAGRLYCRLDLGVEGEEVAQAASTHRPPGGDRTAEKEGGR